MKGEETSMKHRMFKLFSIMLLSLVLISVVPAGAYAQETEGNEELQNKLSDLEKKYGVEFVQIDPAQTQTIKVQDLQELEEILAKATHEITTAQNEAVTSKIVPGSRSYNDTHTITWGDWFLGLPFSQNVAFSYTYDWHSDHWQFEDVYDINSYISGLNIGVTWHQTSASWNPATTVYYHDTANIEVHGYWYFGVEYKGFPVGFTLNDEWNCSLQLVTE